MKPKDYTKYRNALELSQSALAAMLGVSRATIARREAEGGKITKEAELAILSAFYSTGKSSTELLAALTEQHAQLEICHGDGEFWINSAQQFTSQELTRDIGDAIYEAVLTHNQRCKELKDPSPLFEITLDER